MSAIFGIFRRDGRPAGRRALDRMEQALVGWGPDGSGVWSQGPVGLGHLMLHGTPESLREPAPLESERGDLALTATARLDNREELFRSLEVPPGERRHIGDGALILAAYERWGTDCPARLLGDWAFALWDSRRRTLFLARDHFGLSGIYYHEDSRLFAFAVSLKGLFGLEEVPRRLNPLALGRTGFYRRDFATLPYENVLRLRPGHAMTVTSSERKVWQYWDPREAPEIRLGSDREYLDAFEEIYAEAVRCRLRSHRPVGILLSGGLDSGSIAVLAARELAGSGKRLLAFSAVPGRDVAATTPEGRMGDESELVEELGASIDNLELNFIPARKYSPLGALQRALDLHELPAGMPNHVWIFELMETARQRGVGTLLDGWGGNFTISWAGNRRQYLRGLLRRLQLPTYCREVNAWRREQPSSWPRAIANQVLWPLAPPVWTDLYLRFLRRDLRPINQSWLRALRADPSVTAVDPEVSRSLIPDLLGYFRSGCGATALFFELASAHGLESRQPAIDKRVIEFCLGLPQDQFTRGGRDRLLIKNAMRGRMPESILSPRTRGLQSADIGQRVRASHGELRAVLKRIQASPSARRVLDLERLWGALDSVERRLDATAFFSSYLLLAGVALGLFLVRFDGDA